MRDVRVFDFSVESNDLSSFIGRRRGLIFGRRGSGVLGLTALAIVLQACGSSSSGGGDSGDTKPPALKDTDSGKAGVQSLQVKANDANPDKGTEFVVNFSETIKLVSGQDLKAAVGLYGSPSNRITYQEADTVTIVGDKIVITFKTSQAYGDYFVKISGGSISDDAGNKIGDLQTDVVSFEATADTTPPALEDQDDAKDGVQSLTVDSEKKVFTIHFDEEVSIKTASGITLEKGGASVDLTGATVKVSGMTVTITFTSAQADGEYVAKIASGAIEDKASAPNPTTEPLETSSVTIDTKPPALKSLEDSLSVDKEKKTLTISFDEAVKLLKTDGTGFIVTKGSETLTVSKVALSADKRSVILTVDEALSEGDKLKVSIAGDVITDESDRPLAEVDTEEDTIDTVPPSLADTDKIKFARPVDPVSSDDPPRDYVNGHLFYVKFSDNDIMVSEDISGKLEVSVGGSFLNVLGAVVLGDSGYLGILLGESVNGKTGDLKVSFKGLVSDKAGNVMGSAASPVEATITIDNTIFPPSITDGDDAKDGIQSLTVDSERKIFTIHFDEEVTIKTESGITLEQDGTVLDLTGATVEADGKTITITFTSAQADGEYVAKIATGAIEDKDSTPKGTTIDLETSKVTIDTTPPSLEDQDSVTAGVQSLMVDSERKVFTIHFDEEVSIKTESGITLEKDGTALDLTGAKVVAAGTAITITFTSAQADGDYVAKVAVGAISDTTDNATEVALETSPVAILADTTPPSLEDQDDAKDGVQSLTVDSERKVFTIHFDEEVSIKTESGITLEKKDGGTTTAVTGGMVAASGKTITITFTAAQTDGDYVAKVASGAIEDTATTPNPTTSALETSSVTIDTTPPALADGDSVTAGVQSLTVDTERKVFTIHFDEDIAVASGKTLADEVTLKKDGTAVTGGTVAISGKTITITFTNAQGAGDYVATVTSGAVEDTSGNATTSDLPTSSATLSDITPPALADGDTGTAGDQSLTIGSERKVFTIHFDEEVSIKTKSGITLEKGGTVVAGGTVAANGKTITITFTAAQTDGDYVAKVASGAIEDTATTPNPTTSALETSSVTIDTTPPVFDSVLPTTKDVAENTTAVETFTATDAGGAVTYTLKGADAGKFEITSGGVLTFASAPDFENPTDAGTNNIYEVTIVATDEAGLTADHSLEIRVTDVDEIPPSLADGDSVKDGVQSLTVDSERKVFTIHFDEEVSIKTKSGITLEKGGTVVAGGTVAANGKTITITFTAAQTDGDYVAKVASGAIEDTATTPNPTTSALETSSVTIDTTPPVFDSVLPTTKDVAENTTAVETFTATDAGGAVTYTLKGADAGKFEITSGGVLTFASAPDFENPTDAGTNNIYEVTIVATDEAGLTAEHVLAVTVTDVDEIPPALADGDTGTAGVQSLTIGSEKKVFTIHFDEEVSIKTKSGITLEKGGTVVAGGTVAANGKTITITFTSAQADGDYVANVASGAIEDTASTPNPTTSELTTTSVTIDTTPPTLKAGGDALLITRKDSKFTITFSEEVTGTGPDGAFDKTKFAVSGLTVVSVSSHATDKTKVNVYALITQTGTSHKVTVKQGAVQDLAGNEFAADADTEEEVGSSIDDGGLIGLSYVSDADYGF